MSVPFELRAIGAEEVTLMRWLRQGKIPGRKVGGSWYVAEHAWLANGDELMLRVLENG